MNKNKKNPSIETYKQVADIITVLKRFHRQLAEFYDKLTKKTEKERVQILLEYMSRHEKNFEQAMAEYDEKDINKLLKTWIQYAPDSGMLTIPEIKDLNTDMSVDDVVEIGLELDDQLIEFYSEAQHLVKFDELKDLFGKLAEQQKRNEAELKKNADALKHFY